MPTTPDIDCEQQHPILAVPDIIAASEYYVQRLGFTQDFTWGDPVNFAGVSLDRVQLFLRLGPPNPEGCSIAFVVGDADELFDFHRANGVQIVLEPEDQAYGLRDYRIRDLNGYELAFGHRVYNEGPPLPIERVAVQLRLEKRLAALLADLAAHKRMSLSSCVEEILLHTNEPLGDGVASPHTRGQLRLIQRLKVKHGIDYDSHASYRFVEKD